MPAATAQGWLNGKHFPVPALRPNYLRVVDQLGLSDQLPDELWDEPWSELQPRLRVGTTPYLGLRSFGAADRDLYFGRDKESRRLAEAVQQLRDSEGHGLIAVVGASGSGKSSLLGAGIVGREAVDGVLAGCPVAQLTVDDLATGTDASATLVIVDQFEEVFGFDQERRAVTLAAVEALAARTIVLIGLRADAFGPATQEATLTEALARPFVVTPLTREEVRQVIVGPAELSGVSVDDELVPVLLDDLAPGHAGSVPIDVLPLLSNALLVTWAAGKGKRMAVGDYISAGGVASALQGLAEDVFGSLAVPQQDAARRLFLRLVRSSGDVLVRESVPLDDIEPAALEAKDAFVTARMLTVSGDAVRISHDALLGHWSRLQGWIEESRVELAVLEQLRRAARVWSDSGRSPDALIPVERLAVLSDWVANPRQQQLLSPREREFVAASREHFASELVREQVVNRRLRRGQRLAVGLTALATALALVTGLLYWQGRGLQAQADGARLEAQSRQVALEARSIRAEDPNLMAQMSLVAADLAPTRQGQSALLDATSVNTPIRWPGAAGAVIARTADEKLVARANGNGEVTLWRGDELLTSPGTTFKADPDNGPLYALALATVGSRTLLAVGGAGAAGLWDVTAEPTRVADLRAGDVTTYGATFAADGGRLALATSTGEVQLWTVPATGAPTSLGAVSLGEGIAAKAVAFGPADTLFVAGKVDAVARWTLGATPRPLPGLTFAYDKAHVISQTLAVSPDGRQLAVGIAGRRVLRWALDGTQATPRAPLLGFESWTNDLAYSSDGGTLLVANSDQSAYVFDAASGILQEKLGGATLVTGVELVSGRPVTTGADGTLRVWQARNPVLRTGSTVYAMTTDPAGKYLAVSTLYDGLNLWDTSTDQPTRLPDPAIGGRSMSSAVALAPNDTFLVGATTDGLVLTWPLTAAGPGEPAVVEAFPGSYIGAVAVSPDSSVVAVLQYTGTQVALYSADPAGRLTLLASLDTPTPQGVSFSPDGKLLAVPIADRAVQLWDVSDPAVPKLAGKIEHLSSLPSTAAFANHSRTLAVSTDTGAVTLWDVTDPARPAQTKTYGDPHAAVYAFTFSPDDATLVAVGGDKLVWAWHLDSADTEAYLALDGGMGRTNDARFIRDGSELAVGGDDGTVRTWLSRLGDARQALCSNRGMPLTEEEWSRYLPGVTAHDPC